MQIYLMRHGHAQDAIIDSERELSPRGIDEVIKTAQKVSKLNLNIKNVFHSTYKRAIQSALIISNELKLSVPEVKTGLLPNDSIQTVANELFATEEPTLFVGHMPFMSDLLYELTKESINFETAEIVAIEKKNHDFKLIWRSSKL